MIAQHIRRARSRCAHAIFRAWPVPYGLERLMDTLNPVPAEGVVTRKLRGFPLQLTFDSRSYLGRFLYYRGMYEDATMELLRAILREGMNFVDVGANIGLHTTIASYLVGPAGRVVAIEPQEEMCDVIRLNVKQNGLSNVSIVTTALGKNSGCGVLHQLYDSNPSAATMRLQPDEQSQSMTSVPVRTLTEVLESEALTGGELVVKIDVEGAELEVLAGAEAFFAARPPAVILLECVEHHLRRFGTTRRDVLDTLRALGYHLSMLRRGRRVALEPAAAVDADVIAWRPDFTPA
jgi:FkbM family methyltransferase